MSVRLAPLVLTLALVMPGAAFGAEPIAARAGSAPSAPVAALSDLAGESCVAFPDDQRNGRDPATPPLLKLTCNGNATPVGMLRPSFLPLAIPPAVAKGGPDRHAAIEVAARRSFAAAEFARRMTCHGGRWLTLAAGSEMHIETCTMREGNWPQLLVTFAQGRTLYQGAVLPVVLPVLVQAIAVQSGTPVALPANASDLTGLGTVLGSAIPPCNARDFAAFDAAIRQARIFNSRGDAADAETAYRTALDVQARVFGASSIGAGEVLAALALEVSNQARFDEAASYFHRAEPIVERAGNDFSRARLLAYQALDAANRTHYDEALAFARAASALRRRAVDTTTNFADDAGGLAAQSISRGELLHSVMIEAQMLMRLDDLASAEAAGGEALDIVTHTDGLPPWWRANVLAFMGDLNARENRLAVAERQHLDALRLRQRIFGESGPTALSHLALGKIYGAEDARDSATASYHAAFDILEKEHTTRSAVSFNQIAPFLKVASDPGTKPTPQGDAEIFRAIQLTGASVTDQTIERSANRLAAADPAMSAMIAQAEVARRGLAVLRITYAEETDKPAQLRDATRETALAADIAAAQATLADQVAKLRSTYPAYSELAEPGTVSLAAFRAQLAPGEALVAFAMGAKDSWAVVVSHDRLVARQLNIGESDVTADVVSLRRAFTPRLGKVTPFDLNAANALYTALVAPIADQLSGIKRVIFVTHGALASLPLAVLASPAAAGGGDSYQTADWLVNRFAVSQVPTIRSFVALRDAAKHHVAPALPFLGVGAPSFTGAAQVGPAGLATRDAGTSALVAMADQCRAGGPVAPAFLRALAPLPETAGEVTTVGQLLGADAGSTLLGAAASETNVRAQHLDQYRVLYFATHGLLPGELHCQSEPGLALSPPSEPPATRAVDGLLESSEISTFRLNADLVVLSACNTAEGDGYGGDALSGLAEAFFYAGARGLIASHWQVPSTATVALMTGMFEQVKSVGTAEALRQSQLRLIHTEATAHPYYWAAFTLIGDGLTP